MFKIRNCTGSYLALSLERGGISLKPGGSFDLDGVCSRKWIKNDSELHSHINSGRLAVLHDSEKKLPPTPTKHPVLREKTVEEAKKEKPKIIDLSQEEEDFSFMEDEEEDVVFDLEDEIPEEEPKEEPKEPELEEPKEEEPEEEPEEDLVVEDLPEKEEGHVCSECGKVCKSAFGLRSHMRVHDKD